MVFYLHGQILYVFSSFVLKKIYIENSAKIFIILMNSIDLVIQILFTFEAMHFKSMLIHICFTAKVRTTNFTFKYLEYDINHLCLRTVRPLVVQNVITISTYYLFLQVYPSSSKYLNKATKQIDVDVLNNFGDKIPVKYLEENIEITMERLQHKDPTTVSAPSMIFFQFVIQLKIT